MKKVSILSVLLSGIIFGLFAFVFEGSAQDKNSISKVIIEDEKTINPYGSKTQAGKFSCINYFYDNEDLIGYGVKFNNDGVRASINLIKLNTKTGEFNAGFVKGVFLSNKVEVEAERKWIDKKLITYEAKNEIEVAEGKIILKGDAKIVSSEKETIEADQITILLE